MIFAVPDKESEGVITVNKDGAVLVFEIDQDNYARYLFNTSNDVIWYDLPGPMRMSQI